MGSKVSYSYDNIVIELFDDPRHVIGKDNRSAYALHYFTDGGQDSTGSLHGIRLFNGEIEVNSCLLSGSVGTYIHSTSALLDGDSLLVCCGDSVFSLSLPSLNLKWQTHDFAACFQIYNIEDEYLVHGEVEVSRLNRNGDVVWSFSGADIFVSADNEKSFAINEDRIVLIDWEKNKYELDFNGKVVRSVIR